MTAGATLMGLCRLPIACWRCRWCALRLTLAGALLLTLLLDNPARLARLQYAALPDYDYLAESRRLTDAGQFDEALVVLDAGVQRKDGVDSESLQAERVVVIAGRDHLFRRVKEFGIGALLGTGDSLESLAGAITADLFVVGDLRDLALQSGRLVIDAEADKFILILSAVGVVTTVRPDLDWLPAFLKSVKKAGYLTAGMTRSLGKLCGTAIKSGRFDELARFAGHLRTLIKRATPRGAARILRHADRPRDVERLAGFVGRHDDAAFALHATGPVGARLVRTVGRQADSAVLAAARKGDRGAAWLRTGNARFLRPHLLIGLAKSVYKGNAQDGVTALANRYLDPQGWLLIPALAAWLVLESSLLWRRLSKPRRTPKTDSQPPVDHPSPAPPVEQAA